MAYHYQEYFETLDTDVFQAKSVLLEELDSNLSLPIQMARSIPFEEVCWGLDEEGYKEYLLRRLTDDEFNKYWTKYITLKRVADMESQEYIEFLDTDVFQEKSVLLEELDSNLSLSSQRSTSISSDAARWGLDEEGYKEYLLRRLTDDEFNKYWTKYLTLKQAEKQEYFKLLDTDVFSTTSALLEELDSSLSRSRYPRFLDDEDWQMIRWGLTKGDYEEYLRRRLTKDEFKKYWEMYLALELTDAEYIALQLQEMCPNKSDLLEKLDFSLSLPDYEVHPDTKESHLKHVRWGFKETDYEDYLRRRLTKVEFSKYWGMYLAYKSKMPEGTISESELFDSTSDTVQTIFVVGCFLIFLIGLLFVIL